MLDLNFIKSLDKNRRVLFVKKRKYKRDGSVETNSHPRFKFRNFRINSEKEIEVSNCNGLYVYSLPMQLDTWNSFHKITPKGQIDLIIKMPVEKPTKIAFGGRDLDIIVETA